MLLVTGVFSLVASGYIISTMFHGKAHPLGLKLVVSMAVADFLFALKFVVSAARELNGYDDIVTTGAPLCYWSGIMGQFFGLGTVSWNFMISVNLFLALRNPHRSKTMSSTKYFVGCHIYVWGLSALTCIIGIATGNIAYTKDGTCWLQNSYVFEFYVPLYIYFLFSIFVIVYAFYQLSKAPRKISVKRITALTAAFIAVWLWGVIFRIIEYIHNADSNSSDYLFPVWLTFTQAFFLGIGGFVNFCVWVVAPWLEKLHRKMKPEEYEPTKFGTNPVSTNPGSSSPDTDSNTNTNTNTNAST